LATALILVPHEICPQSPNSIANSPAQTPAPASVLRSGSVGPGERAFLLDRGGSIVALDTGSMTVLGSVSIAMMPLHPPSMIQIPHSKRLAIFDSGIAPSVKATMSVIDMDLMKVTSRLELGWGMILQVLVTDDGKRLAVALAGNNSQKPEEFQPAGVVLIDTETSRIAGGFPVKGPTNLLLTSDKRTLIAFTYAYHFMDINRTPEVQFADFDTAKVLGKLAPSKEVTSATLSADGRYLYLLDRGEPSEKADRNVNGSLVVVSVADRSEFPAIDVGSAPRGLIPDNARDRLLILSDAAPGKEHRDAPGTLRAFKGTKAVAVTPVAHSPESLAASPNGSVLYVAGSRGVSVVDYSTLKITDEIPVKAGLDYFTITPDGKRATALFSGSDQLAVLDLEQKRLLATLAVGRRSQKFMKALAPAMLAAAQEMENYNSQFYAQQLANATGERQYYTVYHYVGTPPAVKSDVTFVLSSDGKYAYALNNQTLDVTIVDTQAATVVSKIGLPRGWYSISPIPGVDAIGIRGPSRSSFIDTKANQKIDVDNKPKVLGMGINATFQGSPSGARACVLNLSSIICYDASTMKEVGRQENFNNLCSMLFEMPASTTSGATAPSKASDAGPAGAVAPPPAEPDIATHRRPDTDVDLIRPLAGKPAAASSASVGLVQYGGSRSHKSAPAV